jgi:hypothetical protein
MAAQVRAPETAPLEHLRFLRGRVYRGFDGHGLPRPHQLDHDALARRPDERHVPDQPLFDEIDDRTIDARGQRFRRPLVAEAAPL